MVAQAINLQLTPKDLHPSSSADGLALGVPPITV
jgi:hypothetical protein